MTTPFDPKDRMWEVRVQPRDIIDEPDGTVKRRIGEVGDLFSTVSTAGRFTLYRVHGANWFDVAEIDNYNDPKVATPELAEEFRALRKRTIQQTTVVIK